MAVETLPALTALEAQAAANLFLFEHLPDRFLAIEPTLDTSTQLWRVPVVISYPFIGSIGEVGEILVSAASEEIVSHTSLEEMTSRARNLYEQHRDSIEAAFSQARDS
jgi:hypothetical protein